MRIDPILPDQALRTPTVSDIPAAGEPGRISGASNEFGRLVEAAGSALEKADAAEAAFTRGTGGLQEMVVERARADIALSVAASGAQRAAQALNTILGMQI